MISIRTALILGLLAAGLAACSHTSEPRPGSVLTGDALEALHAQYGAPSQLFTYQPQTIQVFRTAGGGALATGYQAFQELAGNTTVHSPLRLEVREVLTKADMVLSGLPTMVGNQVLESGGHYFVQATDADHRLLRLSTRLKLGLATPGPPQLDTPYGMGLYQPGSAASNGFGWVPNADSASSVMLTPQAYADDPPYFRCLIAKGLYDSNYGWVSYARPFDSGFGRTSVTVVTDQPAATAANSAVYLLFRSYNAVAQLTATGQGRFAQDNIPARTVVTALALYTAGGRLYFGQQTDTVRAGRPFLVKLTERRPAEVAAEVRRLP